MPSAYEIKFAGLIVCLREAVEDHTPVLIVSHPEVLGDDYAEIVESLSRIAAAGLALRIVRR